MFPVFLGYEWCHFCLIFLHSQGAVALAGVVTHRVFILHHAQKARRRDLGCKSLC